MVILDIRLPDRNGLDVLLQMQESENPTKVIMITAFQDMETTIEAMKRGAYDYIHKPLYADEIEKAVNRALDILEADRKAPLPGDPEKTSQPRGHHRQEREDARNLQNDRHGLPKQGYRPHTGRNGDRQGVDSPGHSQKQSSRQGTLRDARLLVGCGNPS